MEVAIGRDNGVKVNDRIFAESIRVISPDGEQLGIMTAKVALEKAKEFGLDLVEVSPNSTPSVCRIMDYGKYRYEQTKKMHQAKKKQTTIVVKEMKFRPKTDEHDYQFKIKHIRRFLDAKNKVKVAIFFRGREIVYQDKGLKILTRVKEEISDIGVVESGPKREGRNLFMMLSPKS
ncbi:MAG: translation initiation factor IF-3 [Thermodesulfobacteriota bacterium]|nr:translation initiation factor IF-3 [Thermodesulfobacteriota bacterium]